MIRTPRCRAASDAKETLDTLSTESGRKCSRCNVIINELLAFVCDKVDTLTETDIIQICLSAFTSEVIEDGRQILCSLLRPNLKILRRKEGYEQKSLLEIIKIIKDTEPDCLPVFVAHKLHKLPPVTWESIDMMSFLNEVTMLRSDIALLKANNKADICNDEGHTSLTSQMSQIQKSLVDLCAMQVTMNTELTELKTQVSAITKKSQEKQTDIDIIDSETYRTIYSPGRFDGMLAAEQHVATAVVATPPRRPRLSKPIPTAIERGLYPDSNTTEPSYRDTRFHPNFVDLERDVDARNVYLSNGSSPSYSALDIPPTVKKPSHTSIHSTDSSIGKDSDTEILEPKPIARMTVSEIIYEDPDIAQKRKRIPLPPPVHVDITDLQYDKYEKSEQALEQIKRALTENDFLNNLMDRDRLTMVTEAMNSQEFSAGSLIIREGESGSHLYVSGEGQFEVLKGAQVVKKFGAGVAFGELAILYRAKRFASIRCITPATVWTLERRIFQKIMVRSGRQEQDDNIRFLASVPLLKDVPQANLPKIAECLKREFFSAGTAIVRQGDRGDTFYIIRGGTVVVTKRDGEDGERPVATLGRGDYFGEQALLFEERRLATVTAQPPGVECLTLNRRNFTEHIGSLVDLKRLPVPRISQRKRSEIKSEFEFVELKDLKILGTLGVGGFGRVELVRYVPNPSLTFALKCLKKIDMVQLQQQENAYNEKHIMMECNSLFICKLYRTFKDNKYVYFLMEPVLGGDVWTILQKRRFFSETVAKFMMACVVEAFQYLHSKDIIYRDLKPENLMMDKDGYIKLVDFGFAKRIPTNSKTWTFAGTPEYVAPEIVLNKGHDRAVDCWALGVFLHELLVGRPPFRAPGGDHMKTYTLILRGIDAVSFHPRVTQSAKLIIRKLCRAVPGERLGYLKNGIADIKTQKWFLGFDWDALRERRMKAPLIQPVANDWDLSNFESYPNKDKIPPDENSGWDNDF